MVTVILWWSLLSYVNCLSLSKLIVCSKYYLCKYIHFWWKDACTCSHEASFRQCIPVKSGRLFKTTYKVNVVVKLISLNCLLCLELYMCSNRKKICFFICMIMCRYIYILFYVFLFGHTASNCLKSCYSSDCYNFCNKKHKLNWIHVLSCWYTRMIGDRNSRVKVLVN